MQTEQFFTRLDRQGQSLSVKFNQQPLMSNSNLAMQAGEFVKERYDHLYDAYHEAVFFAFFTRCQDIGDWRVITEILASLDLSADEFERAMGENRYSPILEKTRKHAAEKMVTAAPTFFIEGGQQITGAQPIETFREALQRLKKA